jgi:ATP-dependent DNA helicase RecQ
VIGEILAGRSALAVLPTGGGKSLCYQVPALVRPGLGLVVSPLIALMADQVSALQQSGVAAEKLDSNTGQDTRGDIWRLIDQGTLDLLYLSPETLMRRSMLERLSHLSLALVAINEAHCVSQWGHDFRPEYRMLGRLAEVFPEVPRLAVTATADARTRGDIRAELQLADALDAPDGRQHVGLHRCLPLGALLGVSERLGLDGVELGECLLEGDALGRGQACLMGQIAPLPCRALHVHGPIPGGI